MSQEADEAEEFAEPGEEIWRKAADAVAPLAYRLAKGCSSYAEYRIMLSLTCPEYFDV